MTQKDLIGWLWLIARGALLLVPPYFLYFLFRKMTAHSVYLYGQRLQEEGNVISYRFVLQNNEEVPLSGSNGLLLKIQILDKDGQFIDPPRVYAGCTEFIAKLEANGKSWGMTFSELPEYDSWAIDCSMNKFSRNIQVEVQESGTNLTQSTMLLWADRNSKLAGRRRTPEWWWGAATTVLALGCYVILPFYWYNKGWQDLDWIFSAIIILFGVLLWFISPNSAPPIMHGYWQQSQQDAPPAEQISQ